MSIQQNNVFRFCSRAYVLHSYRFLALVTCQIWVSFCEVGLKCNWNVVEYFHNIYATIEPVDMSCLASYQFSFQGSKLDKTDDYYFFLGSVHSTFKHYGSLSRSKAPRLIQDQILLFYNSLTQGLTTKFWMIAKSTGNSL